MNKANSFRAALTAAVPSLAVDPDKLLVFIDQGALAVTGAASDGFEYRYTLNVIVTEFAGDADTVFLALVRWVKANQPDFFINEDRRKTGITFEVDHLTQSTCDISIKLTPISESVLVSTDAAGVDTITHVDEPRYEWQETGLYAGDTWTT
jgi:hypothetical protein